VDATIAPISTAKVPEVSVVSGTGGGSGHDGTNGSGPGSGGGVGSGVGSGRGSGVGPGTGGGTQANYPPQPIELFIPPVPVPDKVRGSHIVAEFDVDSTGRVLGMDFTHTRDRDYNKRLEEAFRGFRFRPGTRPDGTPLRMKAQVGFDLP
jgi:periplasmic protein TonB